ncbi:MAG: GTP-binding protein, partial [Rubrivivax sp.]
DRETAQKELAAAEATAGDPQRLRRATEARRDFEQALAHEATARERVEATVLELQRVNLTLLRQDVERLDRSARQLEQQHAQRAQEITR